MIAYDWKVGENSLVSMLEAYSNTGLIEEYHNSVRNMDLTGEILTKDDITLESILPYIVPFGSPWSSTKPYIKSKNQETKLVEMMEKVEKPKQSPFEDDEADILAELIGDNSDNESTDRGNYKVISQ